LCETKDIVINNKLYDFKHFCTIEATGKHILKMFEGRLFFINFDLTINNGNPLP